MHISQDTARPEKYGRRIPESYEISSFAVTHLPQERNTTDQTIPSSPPPDRADGTSARQRVRRKGLGPDTDPGPALWALQTSRWQPQNTQFIGVHIGEGGQGRRRNQPAQRGRRWRVGLLGNACAVRSNTLISRCM